MANEISDKEFDFHRIIKSEKTVALPALDEVFKTLWKTDYPYQPWTNNKASVKQLEEKIINACKSRAAACWFPWAENTKIINLLSSLQKDESWYKCDWNISMLSKVLVDCRLFNLDGIDIGLSENIKGIKDICDKTAHYKTFEIGANEFNDSITSLKRCVQGLRCVIKVHVDQHLHKLAIIEHEEKPPRNQQKDLQHEREIYKLELELYHEKQKSLFGREKSSASALPVVLIVCILMLIFSVTIYILTTKMQHIPSEDKVTKETMKSTFLCEANKDNARTTETFKPHSLIEYLLVLFAFVTSLGLLIYR